VKGREVGELKGWDGWKQERRGFGWERKGPGRACRALWGRKRRKEGGGREEAVEGGRGRREEGREEAREKVENSSQAHLPAQLIYSEKGRGKRERKTYQGQRERTRACSITSSVNS